MSRGDRECGHFDCVAAAVPRRGCLRETYAISELLCECGFAAERWLWN